MRTSVDERLRREAQAFGLRFACAECAHHDPEHRRCGLGWPADVERRALEGHHLAFCKDFELG